MYSTNCLAGSVAASAGIVHEVTSPNVAGSSPDGPWSAVTTPLFLARNAGSSCALRAGRRRVVPQPGQLVEDEARPDDHRGLAREVRRPRRVDVLGAVDRVVGQELAVEVHRLDALVAAEGDLAVVVDELAAVAEPDLLEGLLGEGVAGHVGADEARHVRSCPAPRRPRARRRTSRARPARPGRRGPCGRRAAGPTTRWARPGACRRRRSSSSALSLNVSEPSSSRTSATASVSRSSLEDSVRIWPSGMPPMTSGRSPAAALEVRIWLNWSSATGVSSTSMPVSCRERVDDRLGRGHAVGEVLLDPDGDLVGVAAAVAVPVVVVGAAGGQGGRQRWSRSRGARRPERGACGEWSWGLRV